MRIFLLALVIAFNAQAASIRLAWDADAATGNVGTQATGYSVHVGSKSGNYTQVFNAGNSSTLTISSLADGTWFAVVRAYNASGAESSSSNEVSFVLNSGPAQVQGFHFTSTPAP